MLNKLYIFKFMHRGITSHLNSLLGLYEEHSINNKGKIYIDSSNSIYFKKLSFYDIFETNVIFTDQIDIGKNTINLEQESRQYAFPKYHPKIPISQRSKIFLYKKNILTEIKKQIEEIKLPQNFFCFHIRRGDKVQEKPHPHKEANRFEFSDYFDKIKHIENINSIFIMTDDYKVILEAKTYLQKNNLNYNLFYLTNQDQDGNASVLDYKQNICYSKEQIINFFTEIEIAKLSRYFVGTNTSNIYRYIKNTCSTETKFISLD